MSTRVASIRRRWPALVTLLALLTVVLPIRAAVRVQRPIVYDGGRINQNYSYGEEWEGHTHKGVDFSYDLDTHVHAIATGRVVALEEDYEDGDYSDQWGWGNYVLIQHETRHWDRTVQQKAYVYSIYAHLSEDSVIPEVGHTVGAGTHIANVDNTGNSTASHLHLQVCLHPQSGRTLVPNTLDSQNTSRNPEL